MVQNHLNTRSGTAAVRRIGILGGGQLARMMGLAGIPLGFEFLMLDPSADACASVAGKLLQAGFDDEDPRNHHRVHSDHVSIP